MTSAGYTITSPSIGAIISDDVLYFEGIKRPLIAYSVREDMERPHPDSQEHAVILERYFGDIYSLFLKKLAIFSGEEIVSDESTTKLQALLQEMIKVKGLIRAANDASDSNKP
jgi:hypothetical protein